MNAASKPIDPYLSPREIRILILALAGAMGILYFLGGLLLGLEPRDAGLKAVVIEASVLVGWGALRLFGKLDRLAAFGYSTAVHGGQCSWLAPRVPPFNYLNVLPLSLGTAVFVALGLGFMHRASVRRSNRPRTPAGSPRKHGAG